MVIPNASVELSINFLLLLNSDKSCLASTLPNCKP